MIVEEKDGMEGRWKVPRKMTTSDGMEGRWKVPRKMTTSDK